MKKEIYNRLKNNFAIEVLPLLKLIDFCDDSFKETKEERFEYNGYHYLLRKWNYHSKDKEALEVRIHRYTENPKNICGERYKDIIHESCWVYFANDYWKKYGKDKKNTIIDNYLIQFYEYSTFKANMCSICNFCTLYKRKDKRDIYIKRSGLTKHDTTKKHENSKEEITEILQKHTPLNNDVLKNILSYL